MHTKRKTRKITKWLTVILVIILALAALAAAAYFIVYDGINPWLRAELGEGLPPVSAFLRGDGELKYAKEYVISTQEEGNYFLFVEKNGRELPVLLFVRDTKAPEGEGKELKLTVDDTALKPEDAIEGLSDASEFTAVWLTEPEYGKAGSYDCDIELRDAHENVRTVTARVQILGLVDVLEYEAGTARPVLEDFMVVERENAEFVTDMNKIEWNKVGDQTVEIKYDGVTYSSILRIVDTTIPVPDLVAAAVLKGGEVKAEDIVIGYEDISECTSEIVKAPVTEKAGTVTCRIAVTDACGNVAEADGKVIVCDAIAEFEASTDTVTEALIKSQLSEQLSGCTMLSSEFMLNSLGAHAVSFSKGEETLIVGVVVKDSTAPTAEGIDCPCSTGYYCDPIKFVTNVNDISLVKASFVSEPDWSVEGEQEVEIVLTDRAGNSVTVAAKAVIGPDETAPVIYAAKDRYCYVGEAVSYFKEVFAEDNADPNVELTVDKSKVNSKQAGEYEVTYKAKDHEGNESSVTVKYTFIEKTVDDEMLDKAVEGVLKEILKDDMTTAEKARAIYDYAFDHILYTGTSDKTDWKAEAYKGITEGIGDCFTFYSVSYALLQHIDCQVLSVNRINGQTQHFWCYVNLGDGWYHFDACNVGPDHGKWFMKTTDELKAVSTYYWRFDEPLYPVGATRIFSM